MCKNRRTASISVAVEESDEIKQAGYLPALWADDLQTLVSTNIFGDIANDRREVIRWQRKGQAASSSMLYQASISWRNENDSGGLLVHAGWRKALR